MTLEEQVLKQMLETYSKKGINVQKILDDNLFRSLSLKEKIKFIQNYAKELSQESDFNYRKLVLPGVVGSSLAVLPVVKNLAGFSAPPSLKAVGVLAALGAGTGLVTGIAKQLYTNSIDNKTAKDVSENKYLSALVNRSLTHANIQKPFESTPNNVFLEALVLDPLRENRESLLGRIFGQG